MEPIITYTLRGKDERSDRYYEEIGRFTDRVLEVAEMTVGELTADYMAFVGRTEREKVRSRAEYLFELLVLGTLWRIYGRDARHSRRSSRRLLTTLAHWREDAGRLKGPIDALRGALSQSLLADGDHGSRWSPASNLESLDRLLSWMAASGDFSEEVKRLAGWRAYLAARPPQVLAHLLERIIGLSAWFEDHSRLALGQYTPNVSRFLEETHSAYRRREDNIFTGRRRVEYHVGMVGTEVMNRAFRQRFRGTQQKVVLLPPCMRARCTEACEGVETPYGDRCTGCTPDCRVHQVTKLGEKHGFKVFTLPHELNVFNSGQVKPADSGTIGIVGVSCPLTNTSGGWETRGLDVPAQGLLLDYCGCVWHWHLEEGIPTAINLNQLLKVMDIDTPRRRPEPAG